MIARRSRKAGEHRGKGVIHRRGAAWVELCCTPEERDGRRQTVASPRGQFGAMRAVWTVGEGPNPATSSRILASAQVFQAHGDAATPHQPARSDLTRASMGRASACARFVRRRSARRPSAIRRSPVGHSSSCFHHVSAKDEPRSLRIRNAIRNSGFAECRLPWRPSIGRPTLAAHAEVNRPARRIPFAPRRRLRAARPGRQPARRGRCSSTWPLGNGEGTRRTHLERRAPPPIVPKLRDDRRSPDPATTRAGRCFRVRLDAAGYDHVHRLGSGRRSATRGADYGARRKRIDTPMPLTLERGRAPDRLPGPPTRKQGTPRVLSN